MKKFLLMVVGAAMLVGCGAKDTKRVLSPEETVSACWERVVNGDFEGVVALMDAAEQERAIFTESLRGAYEMVVEMGVKPTFVATEVSIEGDRATVKGVVTLSEERSVESEYRLLKRDGKWLICE